MKKDCSIFLMSVWVLPGGLLVCFLEKLLDSTLCFPGLDEWLLHVITERPLEGAVLPNHLPVIKTVMNMTDNSILQILEVSLRQNDIFQCVWRFISQ